MTRFVRAQTRDLPALTALWQTCFGDSAQSVKAFWDALFLKIQVFAAQDSARLDAMLCALPVTFIDEDGDAQPAAYFYAVCTAPDKRGRGLCRALMQHAERELQKGGISVFTLVPSSAELFDFYAKLGYQPAFYHDSYSVPAARGAVKLRRIDADAYRNLRQMQLYGDFLSYDAALLAFAQHASEASGGGLFRLETAELVCCAAAERAGDILLIKELLPDCPEAAAALAAALNCSEAQVCTAGSAVPFGMCKTVGGQACPQNAYLGLAFD